MKGHNLPWVSEIRYLGTYIIKGRQFRCSVTNAKRSFNRSTNAIFGKVGRIASEEVQLLSVKSKCLPILLYGLECYSLLKADTFPWLCGHEILVKLFRTANKDIIDECRSFCNCALPTEMLEIKSNKLCKKCKCNKSMLRYFNISVSYKRFSFVVIVILLHTFKIVRSHHCLFVCCSYVFPSFISPIKTVCQLCHFDVNSIWRSK